MVHSATSVIDCNVSSSSSTFARGLPVDEFDDDMAVKLMVDESALIRVRVSVLNRTLRSAVFVMEDTLWTFLGRLTTLLEAHSRLSTRMRMSSASCSRRQRARVVPALV